MENTHRLRISGAVFTFMVLTLSAALSHGAVTAEPAQVTFTSPQQSATIKLTKDGAPIPAKDIQGWQLLAGDHNYHYMLTYEKMDGALKIAPSKLLEVGSFDLKIETAEGPVLVQVFSPLTDRPEDTTVGRTATTLREELKIDLPPVYYEGQTLDLAMPPMPNRICTWAMNGKTVKEGAGQNTLVYTFKEPGDYELTYVETENKDGKTITMTRATAHTKVVALPAVPWEITVNIEALFTAPSGYKQYIWRIDGQQLSTEPALKYTFKEPGGHTVECLASSPDNGPAESFEHVRYNTTVKAK